MMTSQKRVGPFTPAPTTDFGVPFDSSPACSVRDGGQCHLVSLWEPAQPTRRLGAGGQWQLAEHDQLRHRRQEAFFHQLW